MKRGSQAAQTRHQELGHFLTARRTRLPPDSCGLTAPHARRRTPGLRREEVSAIAGISTAYYTWIEQGRVFDISLDVLDAIAAALRLSATEVAHLFALAGKADPTPAALLESPLLLSAIGLRDDIPACRLTPWLEVVEANTAAWDSLEIERGTNLATWLFARESRSVSVRGTTLAPFLVALLRRNHGRDVENQRFGDVTGLLCACSTAFRTLWDAHVVELPELDDVELEDRRYGRRSFKGCLFGDPVAARWFVLVLVPH